MKQFIFFWQFQKESIYFQQGGKQFIYFEQNGKHFIYFHIFLNPPRYQMVRPLVPMKYETCSQIFCNVNQSRKYRTIDINIGLTSPFEMELYLFTVIVHLHVS